MSTQGLAVQLPLVPYFLRRGRDEGSCGGLILISQTEVKTRTGWSWLIGVFLKMPSHLEMLQVVLRVLVVFVFFLGQRGLVAGPFCCLSFILVVVDSRCGIGGRRRLRVWAWRGRAEELLQVEEVGRAMVVLWLLFH